MNLSIDNIMAGLYDDPDFKKWQQSKSPNHIIIDGISNDDTYDFHMELHNLCEKYKVRVRIKKDGRTSSKMTDFNTLIDNYKRLDTQ